jgi:hypothetical protein
MRRPGLCDGSEHHAQDLLAIVGCVRRWLADLTSYCRLSYPKCLTSRFAMSSSHLNLQRSPGASRPSSLHVATF